MSRPVQTSFMLTPLYGSLDYNCFWLRGQVLLAESSKQQRSRYTFEQLMRKMKRRHLFYIFCSFCSFTTQKKIALIRQNHLCHKVIFMEILTKKSSQSIICKTMIQTLDTRLPFHIRVSIHWTFLLVIWVILNDVMKIQLYYDFKLLGSSGFLYRI